jgi:hypothetical protein
LPAFTASRSPQARPLTPTIAAADSDAEFTKRNEEEFLNGNTPAAIKEIYLKCNAVGQPYLDKINADPLNFSRTAALRAELIEKITAITWEYSLPQDAMKWRPAFPPAEARQ